MTQTAVLHDYQKFCLEWVMEHRYTALLLDMGLGKTLITLTALAKLKEQGKLEPTLVIAPKSVAESTWSAEIEKWEHTQGLTYTKVLGPKKKREAALRENVDIYIINRENIPWLVEHLGSTWNFRNLVIDELSSFKNPTAKRFKALKKIRGRVRRVIGLTGTPAPNSLIDLWAQIYLLDAGKRLGKFKTHYQERYFYPGYSNGHIVYKWELKDGAEELIHKAISDIVISMKAKDYLNLPERINSNIKVRLSKKEQKQYREMERHFLLELKDADVVALNAASLSGKLLQIANGTVYDEDGEAQVVHGAKLDALEGIIEEAQGQPILVFYHYKHELKRLQQRFKDAVTFDGEQDTIEEWNKGNIPILFAHPQSAGHGLNLQQGGHIIVWFALTWSLELYQQANARLDRQGQTEAVIVHHLVTEGTIDEQVLQALERKEVGQDALLKAVRARLENIK